MEKTTKIENDHADEQIEVEGSSISSKSEDAGEHDEFRNLSSTQNRGKNQWGKMPTTMRIKDKRERGKGVNKNRGVEAIITRK